MCLGVSGCAAQAGNMASVQAGLVSHTAEYKFKMTRSDQGSSVVDATGALGYRFEKVCDGWITEMQQIMILQGAEGAPINSAFSMTQWENFDGTRYRFRMRDFLNGTQVDEVVGDAKREGDGGVKVTYEEPVEVVDELPAETMFPTQHSIQLLARALKGEKFANDLVFDGSGDRPTNRVAAVISNVKNEDRKADDADGLTKSPFYRMNLAYYPLGDAENGPSTEMAVDLAKNGVTQALRFDYGDFEVQGTLDKVTKLPAPDCGTSAKTK